MIYVTLNSSAIQSVGYNPHTRRMDVTFQNGRTYTLTGVPEHHFYGLINSDFPGRYWNEELKGNY